MSNPPTAAGAAAFPNASNLASLANNLAASLGGLGTGTVYFDDLVASISVLTGTGTSGGGTLKVFVIMSEDNSHWTNGINPNSASVSAAALASLNPIYTINANVDATTFYFPEFSLTNVFGFVPSYWTVVVQNLSGTALASTGYFAEHNLLSYP